MSPDPVLDAAPPWRQRFAAATILWIRLLSTTPPRAIVARSADAQYQWLTWDFTTGTLTPLTLPPDLVATLAPDGRHEELTFLLAPDGHAVVYLDDAGGTDYGHLVSVPLNGRPPVDLTPDLPPYVAVPIAFSPTGQRIGCTATLSPSDIRTMLIGLAPDGTPQHRDTLLTSRHMTAGPWLAPAEDLAVLGVTERTTPPNVSLVALDLHTRERLSELWDGPAVGFGLPPRWSPQPGDPRVLTSTDVDGYRRPLLWQPRTGDRHLLALPELPGDVLPAAWAPDGQRIVLEQIYDAQQHLLVYDLAAARTQRVPHPPGAYQVVDWLPSGEVLVLWQDAAHPAQAAALEVTTGARRGVFPAADVPTGRPWHSVHVASSDGQRVQAWLATPEGSGPFPTVIELHGGPRVVVTNTYRPDMQAWLDHGFAFLSVNYRGSPTFGATFRDQIVGNPGHWELEDLLAAQRWLVQHGIAARDRMVLVGESYGGYLSLLALGRYPGLWAGGIAINGIADWTTLYRDTTVPGQQLAAAYFGGTPAEQAALYRERSPITYAAQVRAPVLVIHGRNDRYADTGQMEQYVAALRAAGTAVEVDWYAGGHGGGQRIAHLDRMLGFAQRVIRQRRTDQRSRQRGPQEPA